jgi:hypothetical protein
MLMRDLAVFGAMKVARWAMLRVRDLGDASTALRKLSKRAGEESGRSFGKGGAAVDVAEATPSPTGSISQLSWPRYSRSRCVGLEGSGVGRSSNNEK